MVVGTGAGALGRRLSRSRIIEQHNICQEKEDQQKEEIYLNNDEKMEEKQEMKQEER